MLLGHLLHAEGIDVLVLEHRSRSYVEGRVRAGVLEGITVSLMAKLGLDARLRREGLVHEGTNLVNEGRMFRIDMSALTNGATVTVYGQSEVMKDLNDAAEARKLPMVYEAENVQPHDVTTDKPYVTYTHKGQAYRVDCDFIAGCDGYHGVSRTCIPDDILKTFERAYPFGWLGILAEVPPCNHELIYANHERGFALASMRSPTRSRYYIQCPLDADVNEWPDDRFWDELALRLGDEGAAGIVRGPSFEKGIAPLRSVVTEPMRYGRLLLAGDAAHIVPPTGAKGMNLAASDVAMLAEGLLAHFKRGDSAGLERYSDRALARVWKAERFSWWFTGLTHRFPDMDAFARKMQVAELDYILHSRAAQTTLAENYVGLPL
jgi:p-hydroxybenzoate 3-monooxygenase